MYVEIRPTPTSVALQPDPKRVPSFDILTECPHFVAIELATDPTLFFDENKGSRTGTNYFRDDMSRTASGKGDQRLQTRCRLAKKSEDGKVCCPDEMGAAEPATCRYQLSEPVWTTLLENERIYYRATALRNLKDATGSWFSYVLATAGDVKGAPLTLAWAPFINVLKWPTAGYYHRSTETGDRSKTPWLTVSANNVVPGKGPKVATNQPVTLCGFNLSGLQHRKVGWGMPNGCPADTWRLTAGITEKRIQKIRDLGANIIRLPLNQQRVIAGVTPDKPSYADGQTARQTMLGLLSDIDDIIDMCARRGMYVLLDLQFLDIFERKVDEKTTIRTTVDPPMPDNLSLIFWAMLATRYRNDPAVLYDICNEPHAPDPKEQIWYTGRSVDDKRWPDLWKEWARVVEAVIHGVHSDAVIFVSGIKPSAERKLPPAADISAMPVKSVPTAGGQATPLPNVVYSAHFYPDSELEDPKEWDGYLTVRKEHPIFFAEWGPRVDAANAEQDWTQRFTKYVGQALGGDGKSRNGLVGWAAWSWGDEPKIVEDDPKVTDQKQCDNPDTGTDEPTPTAWGKVALAALAAMPAVDKRIPG